MKKTSPLAPKLNLGSVSHIHKTKPPDIKSTNYQRPNL